MSDKSYHWARKFCYPFFWACSRPIVLHRRRADLPGGFILACNHLGYFDAPLLVRHSPRPVDFITSIDVADRPWMRGLFTLFNVFYLDARRRDAGAIRAVVRRLRQGRVVGWFPEGGVRDAEHCVINGGPFHSGIARIAAIAPAPVIPCVVLGSHQLHRARNWLPLGRTRYGVIFGNPIGVNPGADATEARAQFLDELRQAYIDLNRELIDAMGQAKSERGA